MTIGHAWVDPALVIGIDEQFGEGDPPWANVRVILSTGNVMFGRRTPARVAQAVRHPEDEVHAEEATEQFPDPRSASADRARRRMGRGSPGPPTGIGPVRPS